MQATSTRHYTEQDARLEYLAWRTWGMKQKKLQVARRGACTATSCHCIMFSSSLACTALCVPSPACSSNQSNLFDPSNVDAGVK